MSKALPLIIGIGALALVGSANLTSEGAISDVSLSSTLGQTVDAGTASVFINTGQFDAIANKQISKWFKWREAFVNRSPDEIKKANLGICKNIVRHARNLDRVRDQYGQPMVIASWFRPFIVQATQSRHLFGDGTDFRGSHEEHARIRAAAVKTGWRGGIGISSNRLGVAKLHLDSRPSGKAVWFYDRNGRVIA